ncbi:MAG: sporulation protein YqfD [Tissierellaceae bacterium]|nr:sporulation protein YqfD [Tissierellaceae bacterium]
MLAIKIWNYFKGYVIIRVEGLTLERLLNLSAAHDIYLWDVKRLSGIVLEMKSSTKGFRSLKQVVKKVGCKVTIKEKIGLPFLIHKLKERKMWFAGFLLFWAMILFLTSLIWRIDILGNEQTPKEEIIALLDSNNISYGKIKYQIDKEQIKDILNENYDYLSFVSVTIKGTKLTIEIKEQDLPPEKVDKDYPCHIVAKKKGVITKVIPKNGKAVVERGKVVTEGDILITGILTNEGTDEFIAVHAEGEVYALTRYSSIIREPIVKNEERYTGNSIIQKGIKIGNKGIRFIRGNVDFKDYKEFESEKSIINLESFGIKFPIKITTYEFREIELEEVKQDIDFLKNSNYLEAMKMINEEMPSDVLVQSKNTRHQVDNGILTTQVIIEAIEDIAKKQIIQNKED